MPMTYRIPNLEFSSEQRSIYTSGAVGGISDEAVFDFSFSLPFGIDAFVDKIRVDLGLFKVSKTVNTGFELSGELSGTLGLAAGYNLDGGSIDTDILFDAGATLLNAGRTAADTATDLLATLDAVSGGGFVTNPLAVEAYLDLVYEFGFDLDIKAQLLGRDLLSGIDFLKDIDIDLPTDVSWLPKDDEDRGRIRLVEASPFSVSLIESLYFDFIESLGNPTNALTEFYLSRDLANLSVTFEINPYTNQLSASIGGVFDIESDTSIIDNRAVKYTYDLGSLKFSLPEVEPEGDFDADGIATGQDEDEVLESKADLDGAFGYLLTQASKFPIATEANFKLSDAVSVNATLLDVDFGPEARLSHDFTVDVRGLRADVAFTDADGNALTVSWTNPDGTTGTGTAWDGAWEDFPAIESDEIVIATPTYYVDPLLENLTEIVFGYGLDLTVGKFSATLSALGFDLGTFTAGPVYSDNFDFDELKTRFGNVSIPSIELFNQDVELENDDRDVFGTVLGAPFVFDVEGSDDPGRSGIDDKLNSYAPEGVDDTLSVGEDDILRIAELDLLGNDYDLDAYDTLSVVAVGSPSAGGTARLRADGSVLFDTAGAFGALAEGETATTEIVYTLSDAVGRTGTATATVTVEGANDAPDAKDDAFLSRTETFGTFIGIAGELFGSVLDNDADPDGDDVSIVLDNGFAATITTTLGAEVQLFASGNFEYDTSNVQDQLAGLGNGDALIDRFTYTVQDALGATDTAIATFIIVGETPVGEEPVRDVRLATGDLALDEAETGEIIVYSTAPVEPDSTGAVTVGFSTDDATIAVEPASRVFDTTNPVSDATISSETPLIVEVTPGDGDAPRTAIFTAEIAETDFDAGTDPDLAIGETDTLTITVNEPRAILASTTEIEVTEGGATDSVGVRLSREPAGIVTVAVAASDPLVTLSTTALIFDASNWDQDQNVTVTPPADGSITELQLVELTLAIDPDASTDAYDDVEGLLLDVVVQADENRGPTPVFDTATTQEETAVDIDVLSNDTDPDAGDTLTVIAASASNGTVAIADDGTLTYAPDDDFFGADVIGYTVQDDDGATASATVDVTVENVNDAPVAEDDILFADEDSTITIDAGDLVTDADDDALTFTAVTANKGSVVNNGDGTFSFTPDADFSSVAPVVDADGNLVRDDATGEVQYSFASGDLSENAYLTFEVSDGAETAEATVLIGVLEENDAPDAADDSIATDAETPVTLDVAELLSNDSDPEGRGVSYVGFDSLGNVSELGAVAADDTDAVPATAGAVTYDADTDTLTYDPNGAFAALAEGQTGTDLFRYTIEDELGEEATATVTVTVTGLNDAPVTEADGYAVTLASDGTQTPTTFASVLANDSDVDEGDTLTARLDATGALGGTTEQGGSVALVDDGTFTYTVGTGGAFDLDPGEVLFDGFTYQAVDEAGLATDGQVDLAILGGGGSAPGIAISAETLQIQERQVQGEILIALTEAPSADVTLTLAASDETEVELDRTALTFTPENWQAAQRVTVTPPDDRIEDGDQTSQITITAASADTNYDARARNVEVTTLDTGAFAEIRVSDEIVTVQENGADATFRVELGLQPTSDVVVALETLGDAATADVTALTFTPNNWDTAQTVTVSAVDDDVYEGLDAAFFILSIDDAASDDAYDTAIDAQVAAFVEDDERIPDDGTATAPLLAIYGTDPIRAEGAAGETTDFTFVVERTGVTDADVVVDWTVEGGGLLPADAADFVGGALPSGSVTLTAGETEATITVSVAGDDVEEGDEGFSISITATDPSGSGSLEPIVRVGSAFGTIVGDDAEGDAIDGGGGGDDDVQFLINDSGFDVETAGAQDRGTSAVSSDGTVLTVEDNGWKVVRRDTVVTEDTVLAFTFEASEAAEIYAIGFDTDSSPSQDTSFQLAGSQGWGIDDYAYSLGSGEVSYEIPVGDFFTGSFDRITFITDDDAAGGGSGIWSDVRLFEDTDDSDQTPFLINGEGFDVESLGSAQDKGRAAVSTDGTALTVEDNGWKIVRRDTVVTEDTVLSFTFEASAAAEIYAISFETDDAVSVDRSFRLAGSQDWGIGDFATYPLGTGEVTFDIPVGDYFTGNFDRIVFVADDDAAGGGSGTWSGVTLIEVPEDGETGRVTLTPDQPRTTFEIGPGDLVTIDGFDVNEVAGNENTFDTLNFTDEAIIASTDDSFDALAATLAADGSDRTRIELDGADLLIVTDESEVLLTGVVGTSGLTEAELLSSGAVLDGSEPVLIPSQQREEFALDAGSFAAIDNFDVDGGSENSFDTLIFRGEGLSASSAAEFEALAAALATDGVDRTRIEIAGTDLRIFSDDVEVTLLDVVGRSGLTETGLLDNGAVLG